MKFKDKIFPYPVIKYYEEDYQKSVYRCDVDYKHDGNDLLVNINLSLNNDELLKLLIEGKISFMMHLEESRTMYREVFRFNSLAKTIKIPLEAVKSRIELVSFLITNEKIEGFTSSDFSDWFKGVTFDFDANLIIGFGDLYNIDVTKQEDEYKSVNSIFVVTPKPEIKEIFEIEYSDSVISINVSHEIFETYLKLSKTYQLNNSKNNIILLTVMVLPAFVEILNTLKDGYKNYENNLWFKSLVKAFTEKGINIIDEFNSETFEGYKFAQITFNDLIKRSVVRLEEINVEVGAE